MSTKGGNEAVEFDEKDLSALTDVVNLTPELTLCTLVLRKAREAKMRYPIKSHKPLIALLGKKKSIEVLGHRFSRAHIERYITDELLPIADQAELTSAVYLGLCRCRTDMMWASAAPTHASALLKEHAKILDTRGG